MPIKLYERFSKPNDKSERLSFKLPDSERDRLILICRQLAISPSKALRLLVKATDLKQLKALAENGGRP